MPRILLKRDDIPNKVFSLQDLAIGEIGVNTADGKMYMRRGNGSATDSIYEIGDVVRSLGYTPANKAGDTLTGPLVLAPGTANASPLKFQPGATIVVPQPHSVEWDGAYMYLTNNGGQRKTVAYLDSNITGTSGGWNATRALAFTGDAAGTLNVNGLSSVTAPLTLATVNSAPGVFGDDKNVPIVTVNNKGLVTSVTTIPIALSTTDVPEGTNLYFVNSRARAAISVSGDLTYNVATGVISYTTPALSPVGISGDYNDLTNKPVLTRLTSVSGVTTRVLDSFNSTTHRAGKFLVAVADTFSNKFHTVEIMTMHNDDESFHNEYGVLLSDEELGVFDTQLNGTTVELLFTPGTSSSKVITITKILVPRG